MFPHQFIARTIFYIAWYLFDLGKFVCVVDDAVCFEKSADIAAPPYDDIATEIVCAAIGAQNQCCSFSNSVGL